MFFSATLMAETPVSRLCSTGLWYHGSDDMLGLQTHLCWCNSHHFKGWMDMSGIKALWFRSCETKKLVFSNQWWSFFFGFLSQEENYEHNDCCASIFLGTHSGGLFSGFWTLVENHESDIQGLLSGGAWGSSTPVFLCPDQKKKAEFLAEESHIIGQWVLEMSTQTKQTLPSFIQKTW